MPLKNSQYNAILRRYDQLRLKASASWMPAARRFTQLSPSCASWMRTWHTLRQNTPERPLSANRMRPLAS